MAEWLLAENVPELKDLFTKMPPPFKIPNNNQKFPPEFKPSKIPPPFNPNF